VSELRSAPEFRARWSELHGGYDVATASPLVRGYLSLAQAAARPLAAARVNPNLLTLLGVALAGVSAALAAGLPAAAALAALLAGFVDGLDGAVAVLRRQESAFGFVLDSVADRCADGLLLLALWRAGASSAGCLLAAAAVVLLEYTRARAAGVGVLEIGPVTVGERPTRLALVVAALLVAASVPSGPDVGAASVAAVAVIGWVQLLAFLRRRLAG
jgi:CDP-diacylglycerol--glycerol-3-phosphate 3-phosphatidyltransferase